jgi:small subunit ribosomal protein S1
MDVNSAFDDGFDSDEPPAKSKSEFSELLEASFAKKRHVLKVGDKIRGEILVLGKEEIFVSTGPAGASSDGIVARRDLLDAEGKINHKVGDSLDLFVIQVRGTEIRLSPSPSSKNLAEDLQDAYDMMIPVEGKVSEFCKGGVRVMMRGKIAFCPISQLDTARVETGEEFIGKKLEFLITQFSEGGRNIVVSRRKLLEEQRGVSEGAFNDETKEGQLVSGKVKKLEPFGAFVEIAPGIEGLLHISELSWSRVADPSEVVKVGQEILVKILKTEEKEGRLKVSLSLKQVGIHPWQALSEKIKEGQVVEGKVTRCMKFGAFVELTPGVEGLIPLSEMSYMKRILRSDELIHEGERITVMIKEIHADTKKILLSLKDAGSDPWILAGQKYPLGAIVPGKVERRENYGLFIALEEGVTGLLPKSKVMERPEFAFDKLKPGDSVVVQIGELKLQERRISLEVPQDPNRDDWKGYVAQPASSSGSFGTLGDQFKNALAKKKK